MAMVLWTFVEQSLHYHYTQAPEHFGVKTNNVPHRQSTQNLNCSNIYILKGLPHNNIYENS